MSSLADDTAWRAAPEIESLRRGTRPLGELIRYGAASGLALAADLGILVLLTELAGIHYLVSAAAGFAVGVGVAYLLSIRWVFSARRLDSVAMETTVFALIGVAGLAINQVAIYALTEAALLPYVVSKIGSAGIVFMFNFSARKLALFTAPAAGAGALQ